MAGPLAASLLARSCHDADTPTPLTAGRWGGLSRCKNTLPIFVEFRAEYAQLRATRDEIASIYAVLDGVGGEYFDFDGTVRHKFHPTGLPPFACLPEDVSIFNALSCDQKKPAPRAFRTICSHDAWRRLLTDCMRADASNQSLGMRTLAREATRLISTGAEYSGAWLQASPLSWQQRSSKFVIGLQRRYGLYLSSSASLFDAVEAEGEMVTVEERLGDRFANNAHHGDAHKWLVVAWRQMEAAASPSATVRLGDKGAGLAAHAEYCSSYIGDILIQTDDGKEIVELKNYTPFVTTDTRCPAACTLIGGQYLFGNTEERLKYRVIGTRRRGLPALGVYIHKLGTGHVAAHRGDYYDCIENRKARLHLVTFEAGLGGMSPYAARRLRRHGRAATEGGCDATDYTTSPTARSFVPFYAQRLSTACVMNGARAIQKSMKTLANRRHVAATVA